MAKLILKKLYLANNVKKSIDFDFDNEYVEGWINYIEKIIDKKLGEWYVSNWWFEWIKKNYKKMW